MGTVTHRRASKNLLYFSSFFFIMIRIFNLISILLLNIYEYNVVFLTIGTILDSKSLELTDLMQLNDLGSWTAVPLSLPLPLPTPILFPKFNYFIFYIFIINVFYDRLISLNIMSSSFIHVVTYYSISFLRLSNILLYAYTIFSLPIHPLTDT